MTDTSCWTCDHVSLGGDAFPARCAWFVEAKKSEKPKDIPIDRVDKGCKFWREKPPRPT